MTSTNTFQGMDEGAKPSSRVLRPPGGGSSNIFGAAETPQMTGKAPKMATNIFGPPEVPHDLPKRSNPPGGKDNSIFAEPEVKSRQMCTNPPGGKTSGVFEGLESPTNAQKLASQPKDTGNLQDGGAATRQTKESGQVKPEPSPAKENTTATHVPTVDDHEPRLGPRPRSHNKVLNPPGGKSSIAFY